MPCLKRCRHCGIFFLTDYRNAGRCDIGCPFGCRNTHRKKCSTQRSTAYYQTPEGKIKKKQINGCRSSLDREPAGDDDTLIVHLQVATGLIEARTVCRREIVALVKRILRQHSLDNRGNFIYQDMYWKDLPP